MLSDLEKAENLLIRAWEILVRSKWAKELNYRLMKELWAYTDNRISVHFELER